MSFSLKDICQKITFLLYDHKHQREKKQEQERKKKIQCSFFPSVAGLGKRAEFNEIQLSRPLYRATPDNRAAFGQGNLELHRHSR